MSERIKMEPNKIYRPKYPVQYATLYHLLNYCREKDMRFGQAIKKALGTDEWDTIEDFDFDKKIQEFINKNKDEVSAK